MALGLCDLPDILASIFIYNILRRLYNTTYHTLPIMLSFESLLPKTYIISADRNRIISQVFFRFRFSLSIVYNNIFTTLLLFHSRLLSSRYCPQAHSIVYYIITIWHAQYSRRYRFIDSPRIFKYTIEYDYFYVNATKIINKPPPSSYWTIFFFFKCIFLVTTFNLHEYLILVYHAVR